MERQPSLTTLVCAEASEVEEGVNKTSLLGTRERMDTSKFLGAPSSLSLANRQLRVHIELRTCLSLYVLMCNLGKRDRQTDSQIDR